MSGVVHVLAILGEGGHTTECLSLVHLLGAERYRFSYVLVHGDEVSERKIRFPGKIYRVLRPGNVKTHPLTRFLKYPICTLEAIVALARSRPDAVLTTGPGVAVPVSLVARFFGSRIIYVESVARVRSLSKTGDLMRRIAHLFFVQWEELLPVVPGAIFAGRVV